MFPLISPIIEYTLASVILLNVIVLPLIVYAFSVPDSYFIVNFVSSRVTSS